jgi:hypothetical protein
MLKFDYFREELVKSTGYYAAMQYVGNRVPLKRLKPNEPALQPGCPLRLSAQRGALLEVG